MFANEGEQFDIKWHEECDESLLAQKEKLYQILDQNHFSSICDLEEADNREIEIVRYAIPNAKDKKIIFLELDTRILVNDKE